MPQHRWTREQAIEMSKKSLLPTSKRWLPKTAKISAASQLEPIAPPDLYVQARLQRTREHIDELDWEFRNAKNARDKKAIADAMYRMTEIERQLARRPNIASEKPKPNPERRPPAVINPVPADDNPPPPPEANTTGSGIIPGSS